MDDLVSKLKAGGLSRRDLLRLVSSFAIAGASGLMVPGCDGNNVTSPTPTPTPNPTYYTISVEFRNSNGTKLSNANVIYTILKDTDLLITTTDMRNKSVSTNNIHDNYLVMKGLPVGGFVGNHLASTKTGTLTYRPTDDISVVVYGLNTSNGADYANSVKMPGIGNDILARKVSVRRLNPGEKPYSDSDIQVGPDQPIIDAIGMINQSMLMSDGTKLCEMNWVGGASSATASAGYYKGSGTLGLNSGLYPAFMANIMYAYDNPGAKNILFIESLEMLLVFNNLFGHNSISTFLDESGPSPVGKDYARAGALFAKK